MLIQKKIWLVLSLVAMGCAANTEGPTAAETGDRTSDSEELSARRHAGTYVRFDQSVAGCDITVRLTLRADGSFVSESGSVGPVFCPAVATPPVTGRWTSSGNTVTLKQGARVVATAQASAGNLTFRPQRGQGRFVGKLTKLGAGQCADARDCSANEYCSPPVGLPACDVIGPNGACGNPVEPGPGYCAPSDPAPSSPCFSDADCAPGGSCSFQDIWCEPGQVCPAVSVGVCDDGDDGGYGPFTSVGY